MSRRRPSSSPARERYFWTYSVWGAWVPVADFTHDQIQQIQRTVRRAPEVMVKVTGGGTRVGAVGTHLAYISRKGELAIEADEGDRVIGREAQKALLHEWHLELIAGQYRPNGMQAQKSRRAKLVHNIVLSMPSPHRQKRF